MFVFVLQKTDAVGARLFKPLQVEVDQQDAGAAAAAAGNGAFAAPDQYFAL